MEGVPWIKRDGDIVLVAIDSFPQYLSYCATEGIVLLGYSAFRLGIGSTQPVPEWDLDLTRAEAEWRQDEFSKAVAVTLNLASSHFQHLMKSKKLRVTHLETVEMTREEWERLCSDSAE